MSKSTNDKGKMTPLDLDLRVRNRNLANGLLEPKALDRHLGELADLEGHYEVVDIEQPALGAADPDDLG